jgi:putative DNA primase/helicase
MTAPRKLMDAEQTALEATLDAATDPQGGRVVKGPWQGSQPDQENSSPSVIPAGVPPQTGHDVDTPQDTEFSDVMLALEFSGRYDGELVFIPAWSHWHRSDNCRWVPDTTLKVFDLARNVCLQAASRVPAKLGRTVLSAATVAAIERLARSDQRHVRDAGAFDADPWLINTPDGVVDLRTGQTRRHSRSDLFTKVTTVAPGGDCPTWLKSLREVTHGDEALVSYLQRFIGYTLTGINREHSFVFLWGPGGNGKSVVLGTIAAILGDYANTAMMDTFTVSRDDQHPTHLASLSRRSRNQ